MQVKIPSQNLKVDPEPLLAKLFCHILEKTELAAVGCLNRVTKPCILAQSTMSLLYSLTYLCMEALMLGSFLTNHCVWNSGRENCRKNN